MNSCCGWNIQIDHEPAWGNLFLVPSGRAAEFRGVLLAYLGDLELARKMAGLRPILGRLPGGVAVYQALRWVYQTLLNRS